MKTIGIVGLEDDHDCEDVLSALANSCGLNVRRAHLREEIAFAGFIVLDETISQLEEQALKERPSIRIIQSDAVVSASKVQFGVGSNSPFPFRGRTIIANSAMPENPQDVSGEVIATADGRPVWISACEGGLRYDTCWVTRPWIKRGQCVFEHLNGIRFMNLLPLMEWLRWVSDWQKWEQPPLRACFMFDDPNLHATRYGFLDLDHLASEGRRHHYHTSLATIPLDYYYSSKAAAQILRNNSQTLSLLMHGNNHIPRELDCHQPAGMQLAFVRQALDRIIRLERKTGVYVSRVMAPPHGICTAGMMDVMTDAGFEAACISHGSVFANNSEAQWRVSLGSLPATVIAGLPVIPRFRLGPRMENRILLAAYLNQPIIPIGHHWDIAEGTEILSAAAHFINDIGDVLWSNLTAIARSNYRFRIQGHAMHVQTFSRIITVEVPQTISELELEASWFDPQRETIESHTSGPPFQHPAQNALLNNLRFSVTPGSISKLVVLRSRRDNEDRQSFSRTSLTAIPRRLLTELRDRAMPHFPKRFLKHWHKNEEKYVRPPSS